ncbi:hypothetical protein [Halodesulfovibrio marinisediminis]|uniref:Uncharacterized protein n=1 Tax=Halodesulfovibrio marinisediminis DSM 17456 TaxID=1121457 RepID=A0A1N6DP34_9BACT|nr:hypothetical protein [Halodesulfovibrio marinisediminis]SIN72423.1 hypothetical protein SAMN02745161_0351 [Halodesulfovibrio marinisediminis DSM 17456]
MRVLLILVVLIFSASSVFAEIPKAQTPLSRKAQKLRMGMSKASVIRMFGKPTWAIIPGDKDGDYDILMGDMVLELQWDNGSCVPVAVSFDIQMEVIGWDEGRLCLDKPVFNPPDEWKCSAPTRAKYCK